MQFRTSLALLALAGSALAPAAAFAQAVNVARSILPGQPYTLIYPEVMVATGGTTEPLVINHPNAPLQCSLSIVPVDAEWNAESALASMSDAETIESWSQNFPGFSLGQKSTTAFQDATALLYEGTTPDSPQGVPLTIVHTETVSGGNGYTLDCFYATDVAAQAQPLVDFMIANFATRADADCCIGIPEELLAPAAQTP
jgi:hypothetical protein